jgi:hypothetical protein
VAETGSADRAERRRAQKRRLRRVRLATLWVVAVAVAVAVAAGVKLHRAKAMPHASAPPARRIPVVARRVTAPPRGAVQFADVGDMTFGLAGVEPPGGARTLMTDVTRELRSDLTVGNLETTLGHGGSSKCSAGSTDCFSFQAPASTAVVLKRAGFGAVNVANNHSNDYGASGLAQTNAALHAAGLPYTGRPGQTTYLTRHRIRIALLGFAPYDYDQNLLDIPQAVALVRRASARADVVVVFIHAGAEGSDHQHVTPGMETFLGERRGDPIRFSHAVVRAGADVVLGSGPHVLRAMEWYRGRLIAYSLGNFSGYHTLGIGSVTGITGVLRLKLGADGSFRAGTLVPLRLVGNGTPTLDPGGAAIRVVNGLSRADFPATGARLRANGALEPPKR